MEIFISILFLYVVYKCIFGKKIDSHGSYKRDSNYDDYDYSVPKGKPAVWYSAGEAVSVKGYHIPDGLVYVGEYLPSANNGNYNDACLINPKYRVTAADPWENGESMGYWPTYEEIPPRCRGAYLKWLAGGRSDTNAYIGYVFLFFYGLERRLFIDGYKGDLSEKDRAELVGEVLRLLDIYGGNRSFCSYARNFLAMEWAIYRNDVQIPDYLDFNDRRCVQPFKVALSRMVASGKPILGNMAFQWANLHPEIKLRTAARRCIDDFRELFIDRYYQRHTEGILIKPNKTPLKIECYAGSASIPRDLNIRFQELSDPFLLVRPMRILKSLVEECTLELDAYSRFKARKDLEPKPMTAMALLPRTLMCKKPEAQKVRLLLEQVCANGRGLIAVKKLYDSFGEDPPAKINKKDSEILASLIEGLGFGLAPNPHFHNMKFDISGEMAIFQNGHGIDFNPSREFRTVGTILRLGAMVSQVDKDISPMEESALQKIIMDNSELTHIEKDSLLAFLHWCLFTPQNATGLKRCLADASSVEKTSISHILITVAYADGRIDPREIKQMEKLYSNLGLDKSQVMGDLNAMASASGLVAVEKSSPDTSYSIPKDKLPSAHPTGFRINDELVRIREEETRQVRNVLEEIFSGQSEEYEEPSSNELTGHGVSSATAVLDEQHQELLGRLMSQEDWSREDFAKICKEIGLMVDGAMEIINEWAYDNANVQLIEDGESIYIDVTLAKEIIDGK